VLLHEQLEEVAGRVVGAADRPSSAVFFSSVEKYGEKKKTASSRLASSASANSPSSVRTRSSVPCCLGHLEEGPGVDLGDLLHGG
jgi:hypothetical protein